MFPYASLAFGFCVAAYVLDVFLDVRQHLRFKEKKIPPPLIEYIEEKDFIKSQEYNHAKSQFSLFHSFFSFILTCVILWNELLPYLWNVSLDIIKYFGYSEENQIIQSLVFCFAYVQIMQLIEQPFSLYSTFVIEKKFGFNKQTLRLYITDIIKSTLLSIVLGAPILAGLIYVIEWGGDLFWLYVWLFVVVVMLVMVTIYPVVIAPLFNKYTELEEGTLRTAIEALATRIEFPLTKLYKVDGSTRSSHSNAYFYGFFKNKRIVIFDTLLEHATEDQIVAIVAHELGHYKLNHTMKNLVASLTQLLVFFYAFGFFQNNEDLFTSFGFSGPSTLIGLLLFSILNEPIDMVLSLFFHYLSRKFEYQADEFATKLGFDLTHALAAIHKENSSNLNPDPLFSLFHFSHPTLLERIEAIKKTKKEIAVGQKKTQ